MIAVDPLSDVLGLLNARSALSAHLRTGGPWSLCFPSVGLKFNAVLQGACFLVCASTAAPVPLQAGDCLLLNHCGEYVLCSDPALVPQDARQLFSRNAQGISHYDTGSGLSSDFIAIGGDIHVDEADHRLLLDA